MKLFEGKTVLVTGGSTGIGRAAAIGAAQHGANRRDQLRVERRQGAVLHRRDRGARAARASTSRSGICSASRYG